MYERDLDKHFGFLRLQVYYNEGGKGICQVVEETLIQVSNVNDYVGTFGSASLSSLGPD